MKIELTEKQAEYILHGNHRWNFAVGAVRSGKSHLAIVYTIPNCLLERRGKKGINFILGVTQETIERNVLSPMRDIWGDGLVSNINYRGKATLFGEDVYCIGADNKGSTTRIQGTEIKFAYCDEVVAFNKEVFEMLKSRLSLPYSVCHAACNPSGPNHYIKEFIDSGGRGVDLYAQHYRLDDNPFLPKAYVENLKKEYSGTVYYSRYVDGLWTQAEGLVYPNYNKALEDRWEPTGGARCVVSCDYGTQNPFAALKWRTDGDGTWHCVDEYYYEGRRQGHQKTDLDYALDMDAFCSDEDGFVDFIVDPSAASFIAELRKHPKFNVIKADNDVPNGIRRTYSCLQSGRLKVSSACKSTLAEFGSYIWDDAKGGDQVLKKNDHAMDAIRYLVNTKRLYRDEVSYSGAI